LTEHIEDQLRGLIIAFFSTTLQRLAETFHGRLGIVLNQTGQAAKPGAPLKILVPTGGTPAAGLAIEMVPGIREQPGS